MSQVSIKKKMVANGVMFAELNEFLSRELAEDGYAGVELKPSPLHTRVIIRATRPKTVLGENGRRLNELTSVIEKRFDYDEGKLVLMVDKVMERGLCAAAQAESLRYKLLGGLAVRRACYGVMRFIMDRALGCEVIVSGKLRAQRAKAMIFRDGYLLKGGQPSIDFVDVAVRHVKLKQGVLGVKVKIMLPASKFGGGARPDLVVVKNPPEDKFTPAAPMAGYAVEVDNQAQANQGGRGNYSSGNRGGYNNQRGGYAPR